jgi:hypothetical protein
MVKKANNPPRVYEDSKGRRFIKLQGHRVYLSSNLSNKQLIKVVINFMNVRRKRKALQKSKLQSKFKSPEPISSALAITDFKNTTDKKLDEINKKLKQIEAPKQPALPEPPKQLQLEYNVPDDKYLIEDSKHNKSLVDKKLVHKTLKESEKAGTLKEHTRTLGNEVFKGLLEESTAQRIAKLGGIKLDMPKKEKGGKVKTHKKSVAELVDDISKSSNPFVKDITKKMRKYLIEHKDIKDKDFNVAWRNAISGYEEIEAKGFKTLPTEIKNANKYLFDPKDLRKNIDDELKNIPTPKPPTGVPVAITPFPLSKPDEVASAGKEEDIPEQVEKETGPTPSTPSKNVKQGLERFEQFKKSSLGTPGRQGAKGEADAPGEPLYTDDIMKILKPYKSKGFKGVFASNELDRIKVEKGKPLSFVMNIDPDTKSGSHWVACAIDKNSIMYYDSFGNDPSENFMKSLKKIVKKLDPETYLKMKINKIPMQRLNSSECGYYTCYFLEQLYKGHPFKEITGYKAKKEILKSERKIKKFKKELGKFKLF